MQHPWILTKGTQAECDSNTLEAVIERLRLFNNSNKLKDAVQTFIISQLISIKDTKALREVFKKIDKNGDGRLSKQELIDEYKTHVDRVEAENLVDKIMIECDTDENGYIDYSEFLKATLDIKKILSAANLKAAFNLFDTDGSGKISANELRKVLDNGHVDISVWDEIVNEVDLNGDGEIDLEEFQRSVISKLN